SQKSLLDDLTALTKDLISRVETFHDLSIEKLNWKSNPERWSALECLEHLNRYGDFYIPELKKRIEKSKKSAADKFKSGMLGEYLASAMLPDTTGKIKKMNTFKSKFPDHSALNMRHFDRFMKQQANWFELLVQPHSTNLNRVRTNITIARGIIKLKLGDTLRFVIYHNSRHLIQ